MFVDLVNLGVVLICFDSVYIRLGIGHVYHYIVNWRF